MWILNAYLPLLDHILMNLVFIIMCMCVMIYLIDAIFLSTYYSLSNPRI